MKKLFYILVTMLTMVSLNSMADDEYKLYLHNNYPNSNGEFVNREEISETYWVKLYDFINWHTLYTDSAKTKWFTYTNDMFPTCEGYEFEGYYHEYNDWQEDEKAFYMVTWSDTKVTEPDFGTCMWNVKKYFGTTEVHLYAHWKKIENNTGINQIESVRGAGDIYTLNGVKIKEITQSGVYIVNGKKIYVKK